MFTAKIYQLQIICADVTNNKVYPKTSRKRESSGTSSFSKFEQSRKGNVQKTKNFDKRPKPKGQYHGSSKEDTKVGFCVQPKYASYDLN